MDMFSREISKSGHVNVFPFKKTKNKKQKTESWVAVVQKLLERLVVPFKRIEFSEDDSLMCSQ